MLFRIIRKFGKILSGHQKIRIIQLGVMMIVGGFLEMFSVSLIIPFMNALMDSEAFMKNYYVSYVCRLLEINDARICLVLMAVFLAGLYVVKNVFSLFQTSIQNRFIFGNMFATQRMLLNNYINHPYEYFLKAKSGEILRVVGEDTTETFKLLTNIISIFTESIVSFILGVTVLVVSPKLTLGIILILGGCIFCILKAIRPLMGKAGKTEQTAAAGMRTWLLQIIQGIKEIKVSRKETFFEEKYNIYGQEYINAVRAAVVFGSVPRYMIESVSMSSFFIITAILIYRGQALEKLIPLIAVVAMVVLRLLPAINRISSSLANVAYQEPMLDKMIENLRNIDLNSNEFKNEQHKDVAEGTQVGEIKNSFGLSDVTYFYPGTNMPVLNHATMNIKKGQSIGIVGASGSGKTTTVDILMGLLNPKVGKIVVDNVDIKTNTDGWLGQIGYIPQMLFMLDDTIRANVAFGVPANEVDDKCVWEALEEAALSDFVKALPEGLETSVGERGIRLSGGQRQRIGIARALYAKPSVIVFDEATSALDNDTEAAIMEAINHLHGTKTLIIIAHRLTTIAGCDVVYKVENGNITREHSF